MALNGFICTDTERIYILSVSMGEVMLQKQMIPQISVAYKIYLSVSLHIHRFSQPQLIVQLHNRHLLVSVESVASPRAAFIERYTRGLSGSYQTEHSSPRIQKEARFLRGHWLPSLSLA